MFHVMSDTIQGRFLLLFVRFSFISFFPVLLCVSVFVCVYCFLLESILRLFLPFARVCFFPCNSNSINSCVRATLKTIFSSGRTVVRTAPAVGARAQEVLGEMRTSEVATSTWPDC